MVDNRPITQEKLHLFEFIANSKIYTETETKVSFQSQKAYNRIVEMSKTQCIKNIKELRKNKESCISQEDSFKVKLAKIPSLYNESLGINPFGIPFSSAHCLFKKKAGRRKLSVFAWTSTMRCLAPMAPKKMYFTAALDGNSVGKLR